MKILKPLFYKSIRIKLLFFSISFFLLLSCSTQKTLVSSSIIPEKFSDYKDSDDALYQLVQTIGTNEVIIRKEAQLRAMSLIISRVESKIKSISELRQTNTETNFSNITRFLSMFKILNIELVDYNTIYDSRTKKIIFWGLYKIKSDQIKSLLDENVSLNLTFDDLIQ